jgi:hypothetical protein
MPTSITVHNLVTGTHSYANTDELLTSTREWYEENEGECQLDVSQNERMIMLSFTHYDFDDGDTYAVILKDELPDGVDADDLVVQLNACS